MRKRALGEIFWIWGNFWKIVKWRNFEKLLSGKFFEELLSGEIFGNFFNLKVVSKSNFFPCEENYQVSWLYPQVSCLCAINYLSCWFIFLSSYLHVFCSIVPCAWVHVSGMCTRYISLYCCSGMMLHSLFCSGVDDIMLRDSSYKATKYSLWFACYLFIHSDYLASWCSFYLSFLSYHYSVILRIYTLILGH